MWTSDIMPRKDWFKSNPPPYASCSCNECKWDFFFFKRKKTIRLKKNFQCCTLFVLKSILYRHSVLWYTIMFKNSTDLSKDNNWSSNVWSSNEFPNWWISIKPQLPQTRFRVPCWTNSVPSVLLVVLFAFVFPTWSPITSFAALLNIRKALKTDGVAREKRLWFLLRSVMDL